MEILLSSNLMKAMKILISRHSQNERNHTSHFIFRVTAIKTYYPLTLMAKEMGVVDDVKTYIA